MAKCLRKNLAINKSFYLFTDCSLLIPTSFMMKVINSKHSQTFYKAIQILLLITKLTINKFSENYKL